ncbi:uncharacterized protein FRV6_07977 [Fusarium oxysporum]|uniref:Uncharacterized protein n=1 Tax=Fusarium oxysporum TaxID=5507 RepID=A0A2H3TGK6_FUSOX|nr:uncharacterized protein FRV6_07977 [Fusarium oxysporum]
MPTLLAPLVPLRTVLMDGDVTVSRDNTTTIFEAKELSLIERDSFSDLLREWCDARRATRANAQTFTADDQKSFFEKVFYLWISDDYMVAMPTLQEKKIQETSVPVAYFIENLPVTPSKRKRGQTFQTNPRRMARAPAYMSVKFEAGALGNDFKLYWKDEGGLAVSSEFVRFKEGVTKAQAVEAAIVNWDKCERARVEKFNTELIIALARMRFVRFAREGTARPPYSPQELRVNNRTIKCNLISDEFEEHYNIMKAVHEGLKGRKIGRPNHMII